MKNILLCVTGLTPQIVTETLYALTQQFKQPVDEIRVVTTREGHSRIMETLLDPKSGQFSRFCREYGIAPASIAFTQNHITLLRTRDGRTIDDLIENDEIAANQICDVVRELTADPDTALHASAAGGRKTMGFYLTTAMQLFGRIQDRLSHVLVSPEPFEMNPNFFYIPPTPRELDGKDRQGNAVKVNTADAHIHLLDIPFIRLRGMLEDWLDEPGRSYHEFVAQAQDELTVRDETQKLVLNLRNKSVSVAGRGTKLSEREFFVYGLFAKYRLEKRGAKRDGFVTFDDITRDDLADVLARVTKARGEAQSLDDIYLQRFEFVQTLAKELAKPNPDKEYIHPALSQTVSKINNKLEKAKLPSRYMIHHRGVRPPYLYGLNVAPDRITFD